VCLSRRRRAQAAHQLCGGLPASRSQMMGCQEDRDEPGPKLERMIPRCQGTRDMAVGGVDERASRETKVCPKINSHNGRLPPSWETARCGPWRSFWSIHHSESGPPPRVIPRIRRQPGAGHGTNLYGHPSGSTDTGARPPAGPDLSQKPGYVSCPGLNPGRARIGRPGRSDETKSSKCRRLGRHQSCFNSGMPSRPPRRPVP